MGTGRLITTQSKRTHQMLDRVSWSLTSPFSTNMAISETKRSGVESYPYPVEEGQRYINLKLGRLFCSAATQNGKGSRGSFKLLRQRQGKTTIKPQDYR